MKVDFVAKRILWTHFVRDSFGVHINGTHVQVMKVSLSSIVNMKNICWPHYLIKNNVIYHHCDNEINTADDDIIALC